LTQLILIAFIFEENPAKQLIRLISTLTLQALANRLQGALCKQPMKTLTAGHMVLLISSRSPAPLISPKQTGEVTGIRLMTAI